MLVFEGFTEYAAAEGICLICGCRTNHEALCDECVALGYEVVGLDIYFTEPDSDFVRRVEMLSAQRWAGKI